MYIIDIPNYSRLNIIMKIKQLCITLDFTGQITV